MIDLSSRCFSCPLCVGPGSRLGYTNRKAAVDHYQCEACGHVWLELAEASVQPAENLDGLDRGPVRLPLRMRDAD